MKKAKLNLHTSDGRIDANKAFKLVHERMLAMTDEEFQKMVEMPVKMRGSDGRIIKPQTERARHLGRAKVSNPKPKQA